MSWTFEIYSDAAGNYRWRLLASNGKVVADSAESYASAARARRAVLQVRTLAASTALERA
jgi:uncharacterized protein